MNRVSRSMPQQRRSLFSLLHNKRQTYNARFFSHIASTQNQWQYNETLSAYAKELKDSELENIGAGVQKLHLSHPLQRNEKSNPSLYIRYDARALWDDVFDYCLTNDDSHFIVTGNPGIGKSRSMTYLLQKLLKANRTVIYELRKVPMTVKFLPSPQGYNVWSIGSYHNVAQNELKNPEAFYLIDPALPENISEVDAHTILAASPNKEHYKEFAKNTTTRTLCMPVWKDDEMLAIYKDMVKHGYLNLSEASFFERLQKFGGRPRHVFFPDEDTSIRQLNDAFTSLEEKDIVKILKDTSNSIEVSQSGTNRISSLLFIYDVKPRTNAALRYNFGTNVTTTFASECVRMRVLALYWDTVMNHFNPDSLIYAKNYIAYGNLYEQLAKCALVIGGDFLFRRLDGSKEYIGRLDRGDREISIPSIDGDQWNTFIQQCLQLDECPAKRRVIFPSAFNNATIDAMDSRLSAYQITTANSHSVNIDKILPLLNSKAKLKLYFMVPPNRFYTFKKSTLGEYEPFIEQYVMCLPFNMFETRKKDMISYFEQNILLLSTPSSKEQNQ